MIVRYLNVIAIGALVGSAVYAYAIKYETMRYSAEIVKAQHDIQRERDSIGVLRAEWAHLSRPDRVQALSDKHLDLQSVTVDQLSKASDLPDRAAKVDMIGRKLEAMGMAEPTTTPRDERGPTSRSATPASSR
jgi:cell division protein FtsL